jgi:hypothetical protein
MQDDQGTQWKGTCEGDGWTDFSLFAKIFQREKLKNIYFEKEVFL